MQSLETCHSHFDGKKYNAKIPKIQCPIYRRVAHHIQRGVVPMSNLCDKIHNKWLQASREKIINNSTINDFV